MFHIRFCATLLASVWHLLSHSWDGNSGFFLFAINAAGSVDRKHRQKHGCRGQLTITSSFMNSDGYGMVWWGDDDQVIYVVTKDNTMMVSVLMWSRS